MGCGDLCRSPTDNNLVTPGHGPGRRLATDHHQGVIAAFLVACSFNLRNNTGTDLDEHHWRSFDQLV
jgi:hypothetical protein